MRRLVKWLLAPAVVIAVLVFSGAEQAEARRWRVHYPAYHVTYVHPYAYPHYASYYWAPAAVRVRVYRPPPVVVYPRYHYVPVVPYYHVW